VSQHVGDSAATSAEKDALIGNIVAARDVANRLLDGRFGGEG
jgi:hypothetical protein